METETIRSDPQICDGLKNIQISFVKTLIRTAYEKIEEEKVNASGVTELAAKNTAESMSNIEDLDPEVREVVLRIRPETFRKVHQSKDSSSKIGLNSSNAPFNPLKEEAENNRKP